ncbi:alginate export family protein [Thermodesulfovibrionales bacterium]|nr:alginate export family protein [Thermodesulfovibrionales bacterium]
MRKYLASILGFLLVFSAVGFMKIAPAEASVVESLRGADIRLGGDIRIRHQYLDNVGKDLEQIEPVERLGIKEGEPYVFIDKVRHYRTDLPRDVDGGSEFDQRVRLDLRIDVGDGVTGRIRTELPEGSPKWGEDEFEGYVSIRQAWLKYETDNIGVPASVKVGLKPIEIGAGWLFDDDGTGITFQVEPAPDTNLSAMYVNRGDRGRGVDDEKDINLLSIMAEHTIPMGGEITLGGNFTHWAAYDHHLNNIGLLVEGEFGCLEFSASVDLQSGENQVPVVAVEYAGHAFAANVEYCLGVADVRAGFGIGSGDDTATADEMEGFRAIAPDDLLFIYDDIVMSAAGDTGMGIANTTFFTVGASFEPTNTKEASVDIHFLRATETWYDVERNHLGYDDEIGTEVKGEFEWQITRGLTYTLQAGILFAGDFYRNTDIVTGTLIEPENVVAVDNALVLSF